MFKKNLLFIVLLCLSTLGVLAQAKSGAGVVTNKLIEPTANQAWWGYFDGNLKNVKGIGNGDYSQAGDTYECAIFIPGNHVMGEGQIVKAIRFYIASAINMSDFKVWMSKTLPATADQADIEVKQIDKNSLTDGAPDGVTTTYEPANDIAFDKPYKIGAEGVYIGYSFKIDRVISAQDALPVCISKNPEVSDKNANFMNMNGAGWKDYAGSEFGNLAIRVLLEGESKPDLLNLNPAIPFATAVKDSVKEIPMTIVNMGSNGTSKFTYKVTFDGVESEIHEYVLKSPIVGLGAMATCMIPVKMGNAIGEKTLKIEALTVNGVNNSSKLNKTEGKILVLSEAATRKVALEIYTATWAQLAAKGYAGAGRARAIYGDDVVVTNIHWGGDDPMQLSDYNSILPQSAPLCNVSRKVMDVDPYFGRQMNDIFDVGNIIEELRAETPVAKIRAEGLISKDGSKIIANSYTSFFYDGEDDKYQVAYVLSANGLKGTTEEWTQKNLFADFKSDPKSDWEYEPILLDWIAMDKYIEGYEFNDVPVATKGLKNGVKGSIKSPFVVGEEQKYSVEFDLNKIGSRIQDKDKLYLNVYLIDKTTGVIVNADCKKVLDDSHASIENVEDLRSNEIVRRYAVDGTLLSSPVKGVNIVEYSDGRVVKVVVE